MTTRDLINAIVAGDATQMETSFNSIMASKVSEKLDDMRADLAQSYFASNEEADEEIETEDSPSEE